MGLCSGSRIPGFERIKTLLHSTSFTQAIPGFKVLIIKDCHSFNAEAWGELLAIVDQERGSKVVFVLITTDASIVPINISSRCQKFCFPKLKDEEIAQKLAKILACEGVRIEKEALKLITTKAEGSLKEAEHLLDQLVLLGSIITSSMVQQLVRLFLCHFPLQYAMCVLLVSNLFFTLSSIYRWALFHKVSFLSCSQQQYQGTLSRLLDIQGS